MHLRINSDQAVLSIGICVVVIVIQASQPAGCYGFHSSTALHLRSELSCGELHQPVEGIGQTCCIPASGSREARLAAASALDQLCSLPDIGTGVASFPYKVIRIHEHQLRLASEFAGNGDDKVLCLFLKHLAGFPDNVGVDLCGFFRAYGHDIDAIDRLAHFEDGLFESGALFLGYGLDFFSEMLVFLNEPAYCAGKIRCIVEQGLGQQSLILPQS